MRCSNSILTVLSLCTLLLLLKLIPFEIFAAHPAVKEIGLTLAQTEQRHPVLPVVTISVDGGEKLTEDAATASNANNNLDIVGKWQQDQVKKFCSKYHLNSAPPIGSAHFLFADNRKLLFCFLEKVGCTQLKQFMLTVAGVLPSHAWATETRKPSKKLLQDGLSKASFSSKTLPNSEKLQRLATYWKFTILRNPLERLVSGFRNKLFVNSTDTNGRFQKIKRQIRSKYHSAASSNSTVTVDFQTFIKWIIDTPNEDIDTHFRPMIYTALPCGVRYDFFGNFKHLSSDMHQIMEKFDIPREYYRDESYYASGPNTSSLLTEYYSTVSEDLKQALFEDFYIELDFYYHLFPEEKNSHVKLLGVKELI